MAWDRYVTPFSYSLWLAVAIAACALSVCLALTNYGHQRNQNLSLSAILFYIHACFCQQGQPEVFRSTSGRVVLFTSYMTALVLMAAYSAFLISSLAVQRLDLPFTGLQGLLNDGSYKLGVMENASQFDIFYLATGGTESAVYKKLIAPFKNDLPASHLDGIRRVCADHKYAYFGPNILNTNLVLSLSCRLVPLPGTFYRDTWAFAVSKNSCYKGLINRRLAQFRETGILDRISKQFVASKEPEVQPSIIDVSMVTVAPILVVLGAGYVMGIFVLLIENVPVETY